MDMDMDMGMHEHGHGLGLGLMHPMACAVVAPSRARAMSAVRMLSCAVVGACVGRSRAYQDHGGRRMVIGVRCGPVLSHCGPGASGYVWACCVATGVHLSV